MMTRAEYDSPVGKITLVEEDGALIGVWIEGQTRFCAGLAQLPPPGETPVLRQVKDWLDRYFAGEAPAPRQIPMAPRGTEFQQRVWKRLLEIPYGETVSYGALARALAGETGRMSAQAVGGAVGRNPISILIPCHRVVGANGSLTGYAGGIAVKKWLLEHEEVHRTV